jgi:hypothetical protein
MTMHCVRPAGLLAVFPLVHRSRGCLCVSFSADGFIWSRARPLLRCAARGERSVHHPAIGLVRRADHVLMWVHENVPGLANDAATPLAHLEAYQRREATRPPPPPRIVRYTIPAAALRTWTDEGLRALHLRAQSTH